jgi:glyoxylase-like metal-dependent hydrolase (beta-lactamase superfamily II)
MDVTGAARGLPCWSGETDGAGVAVQHVGGHGEQHACEDPGQRALFNTEPGFMAGGYPFTYLFTDGERFRLGQLEAQAIRTPGHSPTAMTYLIGDAALGMVHGLRRG